MESILYREAISADAPSIVRVIHAAFEEYRDKLDPPSGAHGETAETIRKKLAEDHAIVAVAGEEIVGCVFYEPAPDHIYLGRLAVLAPYRRRGIARELVRRVESVARAQGYTRTRLSVRIVLGDNRAYYERMGYRVVEYASHPGYAQPTYVNMEKDISRVRI